MSVVQPLDSTMGHMLKGSICTIAVIVGSEVVRKLFIHWRRRRAKAACGNESERTAGGAEIMDVFFFPDKQVACRKHFLGDARCFNDKCTYSHGKTGLSELYRHLQSCRRTLDVCVFVLTCEDLVGIVLSLHARGVTVRVITDDEQETITGSRVWAFRKAGISVRTDHSSSFMHHKFTVVDGRLLVNGSFNWTRNAIISNQENVVVTDHPKVVAAFQGEFEKLWREFDPKNLHLSHLPRGEKTETVARGDGTKT